MKADVASGSVELAPSFEDQVCFPLYSAANAVVRAYRPLLQALDLTYLQYMVLMILWDERQLKVKDICDRMRLDSGTLTPLVKRLEAKGLVTRRRDPEDERARLIAITDAGMALREAAREIPGELACRIGIGKGDVAQLRSLCAALLEALDA
ncbi:MAG: MarR family transcriptional regulator [Pseudomonadota bacterium]